MQLYITVELMHPLTLPLNHRYQMQSAIFKKLHEVHASDFWHDEGFGEARRFKPFVFGELTGKYSIQKEEKTITFSGKVSFEIRSVDTSFMENLKRSFDTSARFTLTDRVLSVTECRLETYHVPKNAVHFKTLTPVCVHQTTEDRKTRYFSPDEPEFTDGLLLNFKHKYETITKKPAPEIEISPTGAHKKLVTRYKGIWITGYRGTYEIHAPEEALNFIYHAGLGEKNPQGFGLLEVIC